MLAGTTRTTLDGNSGSGDRKRVLARTTRTTLDRKSGSDGERVLAGTTRTTLDGNSGSGDRKRVLARTTGTTLRGSGCRRGGSRRHFARTTGTTLRGSAGLGGGRSVGRAADEVDELLRQTDSLFRGEIDEVRRCEGGVLPHEVALLDRLLGVVGALGFLCFQGGGTHFHEREGFGFFGSHEVANLRLFAFKYQGWRA